MQTSQILLSSPDACCCGSSQASTIKTYLRVLDENEIFLPKLVEAQLKELKKLMNMHPTFQTTKRP